MLLTPAWCAATWSFEQRWYSNFFFANGTGTCNMQHRGWGAVQKFWDRWKVISEQLQLVPKFSGPTPPPSQNVVTGREKWFLNIFLPSTKNVLDPKEQDSFSGNTPLFQTMQKWFDIENFFWWKKSFSSTQLCVLFWFDNYLWFNFTTFQLNLRSFSFTWITRLVCNEVFLFFCMTHIAVE